MAAASSSSPDEFFVGSVKYLDGLNFPEKFGWAINLGLVGDDGAAALEVTSALISSVCEAASCGSSVEADGVVKHKDGLKLPDGL